jgi:hypothetical protein
MNVIVNEKSKQWLFNMAAELRSFYRSIERPLSDLEITMEIERRFGDRILNEVCIPHNLNQGACLLIALAVARGDEAIEIA